jgi:hypothetical protein
MTQKTSFTVKDIQALIMQLKSENDPSNKELIEFYTRKVVEAIDKAYSKAIRK